MTTRSLFRIYFIFLVVALSSTNSLCQNISVQHFSIKDGLIQQQVTSIIEDSRGLIWIGTKRGLCSFNGSEFTAYTKKEGMPRKHILMIYEDKKGNIWILTKDNLLFQYDGAVFTKYQLPANNILLNFAINKNDNKFYFINNNQIFNFNISDKKISKLNTTIEKPILITTNKKGHTYCMNSNYKVYEIKNDSIIYRFNSTNSSSTGSNTYILNFINQESTSSVDIPGILNNNYKHIINDYKNNLLNYLILNNGDIIFKTTNGELLISKENHEINKIMNLQLGVFTFFESNIEKGIIWVGDEKGLYRINLNAFTQILDPRIKYIWGMIELQDSSLLLLNYLSDAIIYKNGKLQKSNIFNKKITDAGFYFHPVKDKAGTLYFPHQNGVYILKNDKVLLWQSEKKEAIIYTFYDDKQDVVLACGKSSVYVLKNNSLLYTINIPLDSHGKRYMICATNDNRGNYWIGSSKGLTKYNISTKTSKNYSKDNGTLNISGALCNQLDNSGNIWVGHNSGLGKIDFQGDTIIPFLPNILNFQIENLALSKDNILIAGGENGIFFIDLKTAENSNYIKIKSYTNGMGYKGLEPTQNCSLIDSQNRYWVSSSSDLSYIDLENVNFNEVNTKIRIKSINNQPISFDKKNIPILLPYSKNNFSVEFEQIGHSGLMKNNYFYQLSGINSDYVNIANSKSIHFANLKSGHYTISIKGKTLLHPDLISMPADSLDFIISIPIWRSPDFYKWTFFGFSLLAIIIISLYFLARFRRRRNQELEIKNAEINRLNREIAHRFKNHLNIAVHLLEMQERKSKDKKTKLALKDSENRLKALTTIHQQLSSKNPEDKIDLEKYIQELIDNLQFSLAPNLGKDLIVEFNCQTIISKTYIALNLGLIINELFTNSIKHAFKNQDNPRITLTIRYENNEISLEYFDNGSGIEQKVDLDKSQEGIGLIHALIKQIKGDYSETNEGGHSISARIPCDSNLIQNK